MLSARYRFHGHGSLRYLFKNGQAVRSRYLTIKYIHNPRRKHYRIAVIISKKVHKSAVGRNRMRRRIYEIIRLSLPTLKPSHDVAVIVTSSEVLTLEYEQLNDHITDVFRQAGLSKTTP